MPASRAVLRLLDANANRALEGLRVCEDVVRFVWNDPVRCRRLREFRHLVARAIRRLPQGAAGLPGARASREDVGRRAPGGRVLTVDRLLVINLQRAKEALRVLEEGARLCAPGQTRRFQALRFTLYGIERSLLIKLASVRHH